MKKIFLSFASEDTDFVLKLFVRLKKLRVNIWDYTNRDQEIHIGERISDALQKQILEADYFIPIISTNSVNERKYYTHLEVDYALKSLKRCIPIVISSRFDHDWLGVYEVLSQYKYLEFDTDDDLVFEKHIYELCDCLKILYEPDIIDHYKLPLFKRLKSEIDVTLKNVKELQSRQLYIELIESVNKFNYNYFLGAWENCLKTISYLNLLFEEKISNVQLYYPLIVKGACEIQLNKLKEAESTFLKAVNSLNTDENAYGGLGQVYFKQRKFKQALTQFDKSLDKCPEGFKTEILYNKLLTAIEILNLKDIDSEDNALYIEAINIINNTDWFNEINLDSYLLKDRIKIKNIIALSYYKAKNIKKAFTIFKAVYEEVALTLSAKSIESELLKGKVSENLHRVFKENGIILPLNLEITNFSKLDTKKYIIIDDSSIFEIVQYSETFHFFYKELSSIIYYAEMLELLDDSKKEAIKVLSEMSNITNSRNLYHRLAILKSEVGDLHAAEQIYCTHLCNKPYDIHYLIEYALFLRSFDSCYEMRKICKKCLELDLTLDRKGLYYRGFAHYLLGDVSKAQHYFDDSLAYAEYYSILVN